MIYLASPSSHSDPIVRETRFLKAVQALAVYVSRGEVVYSPIVHWHIVANMYQMNVLDYESWWKQDTHMIDLSDEVRVLCIDGWQESRGVKAEIEYAMSKGKKVTYECLKL